MGELLDGIKAEKNFRKDNLLGILVFFSFSSLILTIILHFISIPFLNFFKIIFGFYSGFLSLGLVWGYVLFKKKIDLDIFKLIAIAFPLNCIIITFFYILIGSIIHTNYLFLITIISLHFVTLLIFLKKGFSLDISWIRKKNIIEWGSYLLVIIIFAYGLFLFAPSFTPKDGHMIEDQKIAVNLMTSPLNLKYHEIFPESESFLTYPSFPLQYYYWSYSLHILGKKIDSFRMLNIFFYILTFIFIYRFACILGDKKRGIFAGILYIFSFYLLYSFQRPNPNLVVGFLYLVSAYFLFKYYNDKKIENLKIAFLYSALSCLFYEIVMSFLPLLLIIVTLLMNKSFKKKELKASFYYFLPLIGFIIFGLIFGGNRFFAHIVGRQSNYIEFPNILEMIKWILYFLKITVNHLSFPLIILFIAAFLYPGIKKQERMLHFWIIVFIMGGIYVSFRELNELLNIYFLFPLFIVVASRYPQRPKLRIIFSILIISYIVVNSIYSYKLFQNYKDLNSKRELGFSALFNMGDIPSKDNFFAISPEVGVLLNIDKGYYSEDTFLQASSKKELIDFGQQIEFLGDFESYFLFSKSKKIKNVPEIAFTTELVINENNILWNTRINNISKKNIVAITPVIDIELNDGRYLIKKLFTSLNSNFEPPVYSFIFENNERVNVKAEEFNLIYYSGKRYEYYKSLSKEVKEIGYKYLVIFRDKEFSGYGIYPINN